MNPQNTSSSCDINDRSQTCRKVEGARKNCCDFLTRSFQRWHSRISHRCVQIAMVTSSILRAIASSAKLSVRYLTLPFVCRFSDAGMTSLSTRSCGRRRKSAKAPKRTHGVVRFSQAMVCFWYEMWVQVKRRIAKSQSEGNNETLSRTFARNRFFAIFSARD
jgi:hypothetical protein